MKYVTLIFLLLLANFSGAENLDGQAKVEIEHLFSYLENSGCEFNRNGSWYSAVDAAKHLKTKYEYLAKKNMLTDAESFIEKAASESSVSGKAYQVKCEDRSVVNSKEWFLEELSIFRKQGQ